MLTAEEEPRAVTPVEAKRGAAGEEEEGRAGAPEQPVRRDGMRPNSTSLHFTAVEAYECSMIFFLVVYSNLNCGA